LLTRLLTTQCLHIISHSLFFLHSYPAHRDLHSFPTRRSSDLPRRPGRPGRWRSNRRHSRPDQRRACSSPSASGQPNRTRASRRRSEEHTSELQSRENLVCRLLLEKRKKNEKRNNDIHRNK